MVSSTLGIAEEKLLRAIARIRRTGKGDRDYARLRKELPKDWPV